MVCVTEKAFFMDLPQDCITCLTMTKLTASAAFSNCLGSIRNQMNVPGLLVLSKRNLHNTKMVYFRPNVKQLLPRGYLMAEVKVWALILLFVVVILFLRSNISTIETSGWYFTVSLPVFCPEDQFWFHALFLRDYKNLVHPMQVWSKSGPMVRQLVVIQLSVHNPNLNLERVGSPDPHEKFKFIKYASPQAKISLGFHFSPWKKILWL